MSVLDTLPSGALRKDDLGADNLGTQDATAPAAPIESLVPDDPLGNPNPGAAPTGAGASLDSAAGLAADTSSGAAAGSGTTVPTSVGSGGTIGDKIVQTALHYLGTPYVWGGTTAAGLDCSGLVQLAYKAAGIDLPRISYQQAASGQRVALNKLRPGDLVAWDNSSRNPGADHIAIYAGNGYVIEAPRPGGHVQYVKMFDAKDAWGVRMGW